MESLDGLACDYLVVGAGVEELAFLDALLMENKTCQVIIADSRGEPGGSWCDAPSFAKLDQPTALYGVGTQTLETPFAVRRDEILRYCHAVVQRFVSNGRVKYFPMTLFDGSRLSSILDSDWVRPIVVRSKVVTSSFARKPLAAQRPPFAIGAGAWVIHPNELPSVAGAHAMYVVIGAGRRGMESVMWLLQHGVAPEKVHWVVPRDAWLVARESMEPINFLRTARTCREVMRTCSSVEAFEVALEEAGCRCRVDTTRRPTVFRGACVSEQELRMLRRVVPNIIRQGRVLEVCSDRLVLEHGCVPTGPGTLHINCAGDGSSSSSSTAPAPIFEEEGIRLQLVQAVADNGPITSCFSAALVGFVEALYPRDVESNNAMCRPMAPPSTVLDAIRGELAALKSTELKQNPRLGCFLLMWRPSRQSALSEKDLRVLIHELGDKAVEQEVIENVEKLVAASCGADETEVPDAQLLGSVSAARGAPALLFDFEELDVLERAASRGSPSSPPAVAVAALERPGRDLRCR